MSEELSEGKPVAAESGPVLDPEEIDALMATMAPDEAAEAMFATLPPLTQPESVEPYGFDEGDDGGPGKYPLFVNVQERLVEAMNEQWKDVFKRDVSTTFKDMSQKEYSAIITEETPRVFFAYTVEGLGRMMMTFDIRLIVAYVDAMLGGGGEAYEGVETLSPVEQKLARRVSTSISSLLEEMWKPIRIMNYQLFKLETDPQFLAVAASNEGCFSSDYEIKLDEDLSGVCSLYYPRSFLEPVLDSLRTTVSDEPVTVDEEWQADLAEAMEAVPFSLRLELGECTMDIGHFLKLEPGDLLPLSKSEQEPAILWAGSMPMFEVMAGSQDGKLAFEIMNEIKDGGAS